MTRGGTVMLHHGTAQDQRRLRHVAQEHGFDHGSLYPFGSPRSATFDQRLGRHAVMTLPTAVIRKS